MRWLAALLLVSVLAGCSTAPVYLKHTETGQVVQCGPYPTGGIQAAAGAFHENQCITDYQRQGYERVPSP